MYHNSRTLPMTTLFYIDLPQARILHMLICQSTEELRQVFGSIIARIYLGEEYLESASTRYRVKHITSLLTLYPLQASERRNERFYASLSYDYRTYQMVASLYFYEFPPVSHEGQSWNLLLHFYLRL